ncbi:IS66 family transposase, partial [Paenibacillus oryzisoli]
MFTTEQIKKFSKGDSEIEAIFILMNNRILELEAEVRELKRKLGMNSNNSSKPPSSDGFRKPVNLRQKGGKNGAPKGHPGHTLRFSDSPDFTTWSRVSSCRHCKANIEDVEADGYERRQQFDLPDIRMYITEFRAEKKCCPHCKTKQQALFPSEIPAPVQYGPRMTSLTSYLSVYQLLPLERISRFYKDVIGHQPSEATLIKQVQTMSAAVEPTLSDIREQLLLQELLHADETNMKVGTKKQWLHTVSNNLWTLLLIYPKRGSEAFAQMGVLPNYSQILVHDCFSSYFREEYTFQHALCNAHFMRDCIGIAENDKHEWPTEMNTLLQEAWKSTKSYRHKNQLLPEELIEQYEQRYDCILEKAKTEWAKDPIPVKTGPRG